MQTQQRLRLMYLSPKQRKKGCTRSKSLVAVWVIYRNEAITVYHLVKKHNHDRYTYSVQPQDVTFFQ